MPRCHRIRKARIYKHNENVTGREYQRDFAVFAMKNRVPNSDPADQKFSYDLTEFYRR